MSQQGSRIWSTIQGRGNEVQRVNNITEQRTADGATTMFLLPEIMHSYAIIPRYLMHHLQNENRSSVSNFLSFSVSIVMDEWIYIFRWASLSCCSVKHYRATGWLAMYIFLFITLIIFYVSVKPYYTCIPPQRPCTVDAPIRVHTMLLFIANFSYCKYHSHFFHFLSRQYLLYPQTWSWTCYYLTSPEQRPCNSLNM